MTIRQWIALVLLVLGLTTGAMAYQASPPNTPAVEVASVQVSLQVLGYNPGPIDGMGGHRTVAALTAYAKDRGVVLNQATVNLVVALLQVEARKEILNGEEAEEGGDSPQETEIVTPPLRSK
ncbi:MAG: peptidoglycan-binding domain-containing protein [Candidatus Entotheonellia bacterium]